MEGFEYVVKSRDIPKVAFGSAMEREVMPLSGPCLDSFMRRLQPELRPSPGPMDYDISKPIGFKYPSAAGFSALASKTPNLMPLRDLGVPAPGTYTPDSYWPSKIAGYTFIKDMHDHGPSFLTPGPSSYSYHLGYPNRKIEMGFGKRRTVLPAVAVICTPHNTSQCMVCHKQPIGDYFHNFGNNQDMCRVCMQAKMDVITHCKLPVILRFRMLHDLELFLPSRHCGFFHDHKGTTAKPELATRKELREKIRIENYLYRLVGRPTIG